MTKEFYWDLFCETGAPEAYLLYRRNGAANGTETDGTRPADKENDLILNILTREQGLISAKARAVRTNRSHNKGACQLLCYSEFTITDYKGFSAISEANAIEMFPELRTDIELLSLASYFAQAAEVLSQEDAGSGEVLSLTLNALYALAKLRKPQDLVKAAFELRLACIGGYEPDLTGCAVCGRADCGRFLVSGGCLQCLECGLGEGLSLPVSAGCLAAMRYITGCEGKRLFSFSLDGPARKELADVAETYLVTQLERGFYTLDFYKSLLLT